MPPKKVAAKHPAKTDAKTTDKKDFVWSDDEVELLLNVAIDYKVAQAAESVDWNLSSQSTRTFYNSISMLYQRLELHSKSIHTKKTRSSCKQSHQN